MSGYGGVDDEAKHAMIMVENGIHASSIMLIGPQLNKCIDCDDRINPMRVAYMKSIKAKCIRCISCQDLDDAKPRARIKMLDHIL